MMAKTLSGVRCLINRELSMARRTHGYYFHSAHEGYGVLMEELDEAREEDKRTKEAVEALLYAIRKGNARRVHGLLKDIEHHATLAAAEYVQVAAMARKMRESAGEGDPNERSD